MTQVGDLIHVRGRQEIVTEVEMIYRDEKPFYIALRSEPLKLEEAQGAPDADR